MMMPSTAVRICAIFAFLMCVDTHSALRARIRRPAAMTTTSAPNNAKEQQQRPVAGYLLGHHLRHHGERIHQRLDAHAVERDW